MRSLAPVDDYTLKEEGQHEVLIFHCRECKTHRWNTRHDEEKYASYGSRLATKLEAKIQGIKARSNPKTVGQLHKLPKVSKFFQPNGCLERNLNGNLGAFEVFLILNQ